MGYVPNIFLTVDALIFRENKEAKEILLIQRLKEPFKNHWALPGGFVDKGEDLEHAAIRELQEETSIVLPTLKQFKAYGKPDRDPRGHTVSIVFTGTVDLSVEAKAQDDAKAIQWFPIDQLPKLAFDHTEIISDFLKEV
jgi:8-oxo-dGTP diphosphatase